MKYVLTAILLLTRLAHFAQTDGQQVSIARYWGDREAALSYTFDDGLLEHYTLVFPRLKELGLKASFCIIGSKVGRDQKGTPCMTWEQLREMAADGQEISSHGYRHQSMEKLTGEVLRHEVQHNDTLIYNKVGVFPRTYFFPGNRKTEEGLTVTQKDRVGVRDFQVSLGSKRDSLWTTNYVERLLKYHEWGVTMTHGITTGYDCFADPQVLWQMLAKTAQMQDRLWIATLHDVAAYQAERDNTRLEVTQSADAPLTITVTPHLSLDKNLFTMPLTIIVQAFVSRATQNGHPLKVTRKDSRSLIDVDPHGGSVVLIAN